MGNLIIDKLYLEKLESEVFFKISSIFKNSLNEFSTAVDRSLRYLDKIVLPMVMASKKDKSHNPFAEIIEKYATHILTLKMEKEGYKLLPLGYSSDLTLEFDEYILNIDVKTANLDNTSDFKNVVAVGINQITHTALIGDGRKREYLPDPFCIYPTIPPYYKLPHGNVKLVLTYVIQFIYPAYKDLVDEIVKSYRELYDFFNEKIKKVIASLVQKSEEQMGNKAKQTKSRNSELLAENLIRGVFIHKRTTILDKLGIQGADKKKLDQFKQKLRDFTNMIRIRDIKPVAILCVAIPNGLLEEYYKGHFVSGKDYSKSARYHYCGKETGLNDDWAFFKVIKEKTGEEISRVMFIDIDERYIEKIKSEYEKVFVLEVHQREL